MMDIDEIYDELEDLGINYSAHEVSQAVEGINWKINEEDIPLCVAGLLRNKVQLSNVQLVTYDEGEFTEWLENEQSKFDGGYQVVDHTGTTRYFGWNYGSRRTQELYIQKKTTFTTRKPMTESKKPVKKFLESLNESEDDLTDMQKDLIKEIALADFECGHFTDVDFFIDDEEDDFTGVEQAAADYYTELINMGPAGFYEEFRDELDFDPDFVAEYDPDFVAEY